MGPALEMYQNLMNIFLAAIPKNVYGDRRRVEVFVWGIVGLCMTKTANFNKWGEVVISRAVYADSHTRRFSRWLENEFVDPIAFYAPLLQQALADWPQDQRYFVSLDTSDLGNGYILIRSSLVYRGRAIPISWYVIKHGSATVAFVEYESVLSQVLNALPKGADIVFLADRGFVHKEFVRFCRQHHVHFRIRVKSNTLIRFSDRCVLHARDLRPPSGWAQFYNNVSILSQGIGSINLAAANAPDAKDIWYIITDEAADIETLDDYSYRFDIEQNFLDDKSNGFQVESSKLDDADKLSRLFLILAAATLYFTTVGVGVINLKKRRWVDSHWDRGMSYFKIGWQWLRQQFYKGWPKINWFWLDPLPDPEPAIASRKRASQKKRVWTVLHQRPPTPPEHQQLSLDLVLLPLNSSKRTKLIPLAPANCACTCNY